MTINSVSVSWSLRVNSVTAYMGLSFTTSWVISAADAYAATSPSAFGLYMVAVLSFLPCIKRRTLSP